MTNTQHTPFNSAEEAWLWFVRSQRARIDGARMSKGGGTERPCDPDDIRLAARSLRRINLLSAAQMAVIATMVDKMDDAGNIPMPIKDVALFDSAMVVLEQRLVKKGIVCKSGQQPEKNGTVVALPPIDRVILGASECIKQLEAVNAGLLDLAYQYRDDLRHPITDNGSVQRRLGVIDTAIAKAKRGGPGDISEAALKELMQDPRYWRDSDPEIIERVRQGFASLYPDHDDAKAKEQSNG